MPDKLTELAIKHSTDKWGQHYYTPHYNNFFIHLKNEPIKILEIGVGGYADPNKGGESLKMWKEYFTYGSITAIDIYNKKPLEEDRIKIFQGSQIDEDFLNKVNQEAGPFDIIIDDGSHINKHIIKSFNILFPKLKKDGIYVVEDIHTSYWPRYGGNSFNLQSKKTAMNYFKKLVDGLNHEEFDNPYFKPNYFDKHITGMSFFHNMVFIQKGENNEGSNTIKNNKKPTKQPIKSKLRYALRHILRRLIP